MISYKTAVDYIKTLSKEEIEYYKPDLEALSELEKDIEILTRLTKDQLEEQYVSFSGFGDINNKLLEDIRKIRIERSRIALEDPENRVGPFAHKIVKERVSNPYFSKWGELVQREAILMKKIHENGERLEVIEAVKSIKEPSGEEG